MAGTSPAMTSHEDGGLRGQAQGDVRALDACGGGRARPGLRAGGRPRGRVRLRHGRRAAGQARRRRDRRRGDPVGRRRSTSWRRPARWCRARARTWPGPSSRSASARARRSPDFATAEAFRRLLESARAIATSDPAVGGSAGVHLAKAFEAGGACRDDEGQGLPQQTGAEVARRVVEGKAEFGLTLSGEVASVAGRGDRRPAAAAVRPGHDLLRGGDGRQRREGRGRGLHRGADQAGDPRDVAEGRLRAAVTRNRAAQLCCTPLAFTGSRQRLISSATNCSR